MQKKIECVKLQFQTFFNQRLQNVEIVSLIRIKNLTLFNKWSLVAQDNNASANIFHLFNPCLKLYESVLYQIFFPWRWLIVHYFIFKNINK